VNVAKSTARSRAGSAASASRDGDPLIARSDRGRSVAAGVADGAETHLVDGALLFEQVDDIEDLATLLFGIIQPRESRRHVSFWRLERFQAGLRPMCDRPGHTTPQGT
jgi:hypothetical protein